MDIQTVKFVLDTWKCVTCKYTQDFDPANAELMALNFPYVPVGKCPSCYKEGRKGKKISEMAEVTNDNEKIKVDVTDPASIPEAPFTVLDENGERLMTVEEKAILVKQAGDDIAYLRNASNAKEKAV